MFLTGWFDVRFVAVAVAHRFISCFEADVVVTRHTGTYYLHYVRTMFTVQWDFKIVDDDWILTPGFSFVIIFWVEKLSFYRSIRIKAILHYRVLCVRDLFGTCGVSSYVDFPHISSNCKISLHVTSRMGSYPP